MEKPPSEYLPEIEAAYESLSPLDKCRETYLIATIFREEMGLPSSWDYQQENARRDYARRVGECVNDSVATETALGNCSSEVIEDIIVHHVVGETQHRWMTYTERIKSADRVDTFTEKIPTDETVTCDLEEKSIQLRLSWRKYLEDYGQKDAEFIADVRAEFVRNKVIWDTAKESIFLAAVLATDEHEVAA